MCPILEVHVLPSIYSYQCSILRGRTSVWFYPMLREELEHRSLFCSSTTQVLSCSYLTLLTCKSVYIQSVYNVIVSHLMCDKKTGVFNCSPAKISAQWRHSELLQLESYRNGLPILFTLNNFIRNPRDLSSLIPFTKAMLENHHILDCCRNIL